MKVTYFGSGLFGIHCLEALAEGKGDCNIELAGIFTQPTRPAGRKKKLTPTPVAVWAKENLIPCIETANINSPEMIEKATSYKSDLIVVISFGQFIGSKIIDLHPNKAINVHASLLPKYRGAAPINWPIINGDIETGITIITVEKKMDSGPILAKSKIPITPDDNAETIGEKLSQISPPVLMEVISRIEAGKAVYTQQDESEVTLAPKLQKSDGFIDWTQPADTINNKVRGLYPWPGAQTDYLSGKSAKLQCVTITKARVIATDKTCETAGLLDENLNVICGTKALKILQIKPAGGKVMDFKSFTNGRDTKPGDSFLHIKQNNKKTKK